MSACGFLNPYNEAQSLCSQYSSSQAVAAGLVTTRLANIRSLTTILLSVTCMPFKQLAEAGLRSLAVSLARNGGSATCEQLVKYRAVTGTIFPNIASDSGGIGTVLSAAPLQNCGGLILSLYDQCGGENNCPSGVSCADSQW